MVFSETADLENTVHNTAEFKLRFFFLKKLRKRALNNLWTIGIQQYFIKHINTSVPCRRFQVFARIWNFKMKVDENLKKGCWRKLSKKSVPVFGCDSISIVLIDHDLLA